MNIDKLIERYQTRMSAIEPEIIEIQEWMENDFNPYVASGGNAEDAYYMGSEHGELFREYEILGAVIEELKALKENV